MAGVIDVVIPTIGRASLRTLLDSLERAQGTRPHRIIIVDDRRDRGTALDLGSRTSELLAGLSVIAAGGRGPAAARNVGWRASRAQWIAFLDDDVVVEPWWLRDLHTDLDDLPCDVAASTGRVVVPLPAGRAPTDWERNVAGLATARYITADCAYRRSELLAVGGFDERFARAYREDADLAIRVVARGGRIVEGSRRVTHPVRSAPWWISVALQRGNADDVLMRALHGRSWRALAGAPRGRLPLHVMTVAAATFALSAAIVGQRRLATSAIATWAALTTRFAWERIAPGPRSSREIALLLTTSVAIPFAAVGARVAGVARLRGRLRERVRAPRPSAAAVLFDRDGTLIVDVPYNGDPGRVVPMPHAASALARIREAGLFTAVVSNQSGIGLGLIADADVQAVNAQVDALLGPLGPVLVCPHAPGAGCGCRKPAPGLIEQAARQLGIAPRDCVVIGDIGGDMEAARAAGARAILIATPVTLPQEVADAPAVAADLEGAVSMILAGAV